MDSAILGQTSATSDDSEFVLAGASYTFHKNLWGGRHSKNTVTL
jgi:hypothetical protein